jgi:GDP-D-mannose dehydratase
MKKALITGVTGQDGSYLAEFLLEKGYCWRRFKSEPPRRLKTEPGVEAARERVGCG